eukprot:3423477-Rhodomonas_salina.1
MLLPGQTTRLVLRALSATERDGTAAISLRICYAVSGSDIAYQPCEPPNLLYAMTLRICYAMPGNDVVSLSVLFTCYAESGTEIGCAASCISYAVSGTERGYAATRREDRRTCYQIPNGGCNYAMICSTPARGTMPSPNFVYGATKGVQLCDDLLYPCAGNELGEAAQAEEEQQHGPRVWCDQGYDVMSGTDLAKVAVIHYVTSGSELAYAAVRTMCPGGGGLSEAEIIGIVLAVVALCYAASPYPRSSIALLVLMQRYAATPYLRIILVLTRWYGLLGSIRSSVCSGAETVCSVAGQYTGGHPGETAAAETEPPSPSSSSSSS